MNNLLHGYGVALVLTQALLNRFFSLHFVLPFVIVGVVILHPVALHRFGSNNPIGIDIKGPAGYYSVSSYYTIKDLFGLGIFLTLWRQCFSFPTLWDIPTIIYPLIHGNSVHTL